MSQDNLTTLYRRNLTWIVSKLPKGLAQLMALMAVYVYVVSPLLILISLFHLGYLPEDSGWHMAAALIGVVVLAYLLVIIPLGMALNDKLRFIGESDR